MIDKNKTKEGVKMEKRGTLICESVGRFNGDACGDCGECFCGVPHEYNSDWCGHNCAGAKPTCIPYVEKKEEVDLNKKYRTECEDIGEGCCPACDSYVDYIGKQIGDTPEEVGYEFECPHCGFKGVEWYSLEFVETYRE